MMILEVVAFTLLLALWSAVATYAILFYVVPTFFPKKPYMSPGHIPKRQKPRASGNYSSHDGFKSLRKNEYLTVDDIVTGLSRDRK